MDELGERRISFLFVRCQTRLDQGDLVVSVPQGSMCRAGSSGDAGLTWDDPLALPDEVVVSCAPGPRRRTDHAEYASQEPYPQPSELRFQGAVTYGRVPTLEGWALCVQGAVRALDGLPQGWAGRDAVMVSSPSPPPATLAPAGDGGPVNGPHLPWP
jgi:hypothetical protein